MPEIDREEIHFGDIDMFLPKQARAVAMARKLLDLFEEDIPKPETLRNVSPEIIAPPAKAASLTVSGRPETQDMQPGSNPGGATSDFIFQECEPFKWFNLPTFRAGKTMYHLQQGKVHIMREGYGDSTVFAYLDDLKKLMELTVQEFAAAALPFKSTNSKYYLISGFLRDVDFSKIGVKDDTHECSGDDGRCKARKKSQAEINPVPQSSDSSALPHEVKCPECGSDKVQKNGIYRLGSHPPRQKYACTKCDKRWVGNEIEKKAEQKAPEVEQTAPKVEQQDITPVEEKTAASPTDASQVEHKEPVPAPEPEPKPQIEMSERTKKLQEIARINKERWAAEHPKKDEKVA